MLRTIAVFALLLSSIPASAQWIAGGGYQSISDDVINGSITLGAVYGSIAYDVDFDGPFSLVPEIRVSTGITDDTLAGFGDNVELDYLYIFSVRGQFDISPDVYAYVVPSFGRIQLSAVSGIFSFSGSETESGIGGGIGYGFSEKTSAEISFEDFGGTSILSLGFRYTF